MLPTFRAGLSRRTLARTTALLPVAWFVQAGSCSTTAFMPATLIAQAVALAKGLSGMLAQLMAADPGLIPAATLATLQNDLALATGAASALTTNLPAPSGASIAQTIDGYINAVLSTLAAPPINGLIPSPFNMAVAAASLLVPELEAFVNTYLPASVTAAAASPAAVTARQKFAALAPGMNAQGALTVLQGYVK